MSRDKNSYLIGWREVELSEENEKHHKQTETNLKRKGFEEGESLV